MSNLKKIQCNHQHSIQYLGAGCDITKFAPIFLYFIKCILHNIIVYFCDEVEKDSGSHCS